MEAYQSSIYISTLLNCEEHTSQTHGLCHVYDGVSDQGLLH